MKSVEIALESGKASWEPASYGEPATINLWQENETLPAYLGDDRMQMVTLELPAMRSLREACRHGQDWQGGNTQSRYMGRNAIILAQHWGEAPGEPPYTSHQDIVLSLEELDSCIVMAEAAEQA